MSGKLDFSTRLNRVLRYNRCRIDRALSIFTPQQRPLFFALPFLLNVNHADFPGFVDNEDMPYGLAHYTLKEEDKQHVISVFKAQALLFEDIKSLWPKARCIESLSLMGSIGTMAQSEKSDLDYWVCVDGKKVKGQGWDLLQQKLTLIEQWAWQQHQLEVHFFLSDIEKIRNSDFGQADGESAGSAQPMFLKNEYYSTNIMISGKIPFWWISSCQGNDKRYQQELALFKRGTKPNPKHVIDLGNVHKLHANEMFGAMIWQLSKAMDSPFKSVLKMAKLEVFSDDSLNRIALCNVLKAKVHRNATLIDDVRGSDPYTLMFDQIIDYYRDKHPKYLPLFYACLYIKSDCRFSHTSTAQLPPLKREVMLDYLQEWKWGTTKVEHYDNVKQWEYKQVASLGQLIHSFLVSSYRRVSESIKGHKQLVSDEDMTVIGRKIASFYGSKEGKIQYLKRAFEQGLIQPEITITMELDLNLNTKQRWSAFRGRVHLQNANNANPAFLTESCDPVDLVLWCIFNRVISNDSNFYLLQSKLPMAIADISELMDSVLLDCQPIKISELARDKLLAPCQIVHCLVVLNFASHSSVREVETVRVIYLTSWGELYSFAGLKAFSKARKRFSEQQQQPLCRLFTPSRNNRKLLYRQIENSFDFVFDKVGVLSPPVKEQEQEQE